MRISTNPTQSEPTALEARHERDLRASELLDLAARTSGAERRSALDEVVELHIEMAHNLASRYFGRSIPEDDLHQVACLALVKAVHGFDGEKCPIFAAYAIPTIRGELRRYFRDTGWAIRPPRRIQELQSDVWHTEAELVQQLGRTPTAQEVADALGCCVDEVHEVAQIDGCFTPTSLDRTVSTDTDLTLIARLSALEGGFASADARTVLAPLLQILSERERKILDLRFVDELTQQEIGTVVGLSQMQVSRLLSGIYLKLREALGEDVGSSTAA